MPPSLMTSFAPALADVSGRIASSAIAGLWESLLLTIAVALALRLAPGVPARVRFLLWTVTFAVLALLPFVHPASAAASHPVSSAVLTLGIGWSIAIAALWIAISSFRIVSMAREAYRLRRIWKRALPLADESPRSIGARHARLCASSDVDRPSVIGFIAPRILIPDWLLSKLTPAELDHIVLHELEHLRRRDDWSNLLQKLSLALFPLNPVLLWIENRLCLEREMACDEGVLARTAAPHAYATCLTNLAEHSLYRRALSLSLGALELKSQLARRVYSILRRPATMRPWQQASLSATVVLSLLGGAASLARCPQLVAFTATQPEHTATTFAPPANFAVASSVGATGTLGAHMVSLKAEMPTPAAPLKLAEVRSAAMKPATRLPHRAVLQRRSAQPQPDQPNWLVLTSDDIPVHHHIVVTVFQDPYTSNSYAAVPTDTGWLVLQL